MCNPTATCTPTRNLLHKKHHRLCLNTTSKPKRNIKKKTNKEAFSYLVGLFLYKAGVRATQIWFGCGASCMLNVIRHSMLRHENKIGEMRDADEQTKNEQAAI